MGVKNRQRIAASSLNLLGLVVICRLARLHGCGCCGLALRLFARSQTGLLGCLALVSCLLPCLLKQTGWLGYVISVFIFALLGCTPTQRALRDRLMSRGKNCLPTVSRQFLTRNYPRPNCLLKCLPNCLSPTREGFLSPFKINSAVRVIARQVRGKNCLAAIFAPRHQSVSSGPLGRGSCNCTLVRRVLRRFSRRVLRRRPVRVFSKDKVLRRVLRRERFREGA